MDDSILTNNHGGDDDNDTIDRSDEIVTDIISLIHSTTHSSYVTCSQLSSKLISYLSQIHINDNQWNDLEKAVQRFDQSIDHPDLRRFRQLIETISMCANDCEERNYTLGRDANTLFESIRQLRELLQSHVNLNCSLLSKVVQQKDVRILFADLMNLTGMNVGNQIHGFLSDIVHLLCQIDRSFSISNVIDHPIVANCIRIIQTSINSIYSTGV
jgi:hypothetical protein